MVLSKGRALPLRQGGETSTCFGDSLSPSASGLVPRSLGVSRNCVGSRLLLSRCCCAQPDMRGPLRQAPAVRTRADGREVAGYDHGEARQQEGGDGSNGASGKGVTKGQEGALCKRVEGGDERRDSAGPRVVQSGEESDEVGAKGGGEVLDQRRRRRRGNHLRPASSITVEGTRPTSQESGCQGLGGAREEGFAVESGRRRVAPGGLPQEGSDIDEGRDQGQREYLESRFVTLP